MPGRADKTHAHLHSLLSTGILVHIAVVSGILPGVHPLNASHQHGHSCKRAAGIPCGSFLFLFPASTSFSNPAHERHDCAVEHTRDCPEDPCVLRLRIPPRAERPEQVRRRGREPVDAADHTDDTVLPLARPDLVALFEQTVHRRPIHAARDKHCAADARQHEQQADRPDIQQTRPVQTDGDKQRHR